MKQQLRLQQNRREPSRVFLGLAMSTYHFRKKYVDANPTLYVFFGKKNNINVYKKLWSSVWPTGRKKITPRSLKERGRYFLVRPTWSITIGWKSRTGSVLDNDRRLVWWQCKDCGKKYILSIYDRLLKQKRGHSSCPFCNGRRIKLVHYI